MFLLLLVLVLPASAHAQETGGFTLGLRVGGVIGTRLVADDIGRSLLPDTLIADGFRRDSISVTMGPAPDLTLVAGLDVNEETSLQLAAGYTFGSLDVVQSGGTRDAGSIAIGHAVLAVQKPVRGFLGRAGVGALWFQGGEFTAVEDMRTINPLLELGVARRWPWSGFDLDAGLAAQATQLTSDAIDARGGKPGFVYRLALEVGLTRRLGR